MAQAPFSASVSAWVKKTEARMEAVRKESVQRTVETMQTPRAAGGNLRVDTGFLRASLVASVGASVPALVAKPDGATRFSYDAGQISLVISGSTIKDPITVAYAANYARPREYGSRGQPGDRWVGLAAQQWPRIVSEVAKEAQARAGG